MCPKNNINNNMVQVIPSPIEHMPIFEQVILCLNEQYVQMNKMFKYGGLMFHGKYWILDSKLLISLDRPEKAWGGEEYKAWEGSMHEQVLFPIYNILADLNYSIEEQKNIFKDQQNRYARKGDLRLDVIEESGSIEVHFFQNANAPRRPDNGGRYEWDKVNLMPFLMRLEMVRTMNRIIQFLQDKFDITQDLERVVKKIGLGGMTTAQWLEQYDGQHDDGLVYASNTESADKKTLSNGDRVWFYDHKGRLKVGIARYNINNMWWVITGKYYRTNEGAFNLYLSPPHCPRKKNNTYDRRNKMSQEAFNCRANGDVERANKLDALIQQEYGDTGLWITRDQARDYFVRCGLSYSNITKYKFDLLRKMVNEKLIQSARFRESYKCNRKTKFFNNRAGLSHAYIGCQAFYFGDREAISFNKGGEIGFAGWADNGAVKPILEAFVEWCDRIKK